MTSPLSGAFAQVMPPGKQQHSAGMAGKMGAAGSTSTAMRSDLPGFPGASHIYHVGASGFFLDYAAAIKLTTNQQAALNGIKEKSIGDLAAAQRQIDQAEQELWMLTSSDRPDPMTLETKVREIERLKGDQRIAFIRSVGEAARVLTDDQRAALLGTGAPGAVQVTAPPGSAGSANPQGGMGSTDPKAGMAGMADDSMGSMGGGKPPDTKSNNGGMGDM
jgi:Spy/CpxP family protein refolding chaperone